VHLDDVAPIAGVHGLQGHAGHERGPVKPVFLESFPGGDPGFEVQEVIRSRADQVDIGVQGRIKGRVQMDVTQAKRHRGWRANDQRRHRPLKGFGSHSRYSAALRPREMSQKTKAWTGLRKSTLRTAI
jgi:hypothetical protein